MSFCGHDIFPFNKNKEKLKNNGVIAVVSDHDILKICRDKILTFEYLNKKFNLPFTTDKKNKISEFPIISKPRYCKDSRETISKSMIMRSWIMLIPSIQI